MGFLKWIQIGKGTHTEAHCQENKGTVKLEQRPVTMGGTTTHRTLPPKRTPSNWVWLTDPGVKGAYGKMNQPHISCATVRQ
jgi:hypothetical protein